MKVHFQPLKLLKSPKSPVINRVTWKLNETYLSDGCIVVGHRGVLVFPSTSHFSQTVYFLLLSHEVGLHITLECN